MLMLRSARGVPTRVQWLYRRRSRSAAVHFCAFLRFAQRPQNVMRPAAGRPVASRGPLPRGGAGRAGRAGANTTQLPTTADRRTHCTQRDDFSKLNHSVFKSARQPVRRHGLSSIARNVSLGPPERLSRCGATQPATVVRRAQRQAFRWRGRARSIR